MSEAPASNEAAEGVVGSPPLNPDEVKAFEWYLKSANSGSLRGIQALIKCYDNGVGTPKDEIKGFEWCKFAAENHRGAAQHFNVGQRYESGKGVGRSLKDAAHWYRNAANSDHTEAMFCLATVLQQDMTLREYAYHSYEAVVDWYTKAGDRGHVDAMYEAGMCYAYGRGETYRCRFSAKEWFTKAAETGHREAMYEVGEVSDEKEAATWYAKAADLGHVKGMYQLGRCFEKGLGVDKDEAKAVEWYTKASNLNNTHAMRALADCYKNGIGVAKNIDKFIEWSTAASDLGDAEAMSDLGEYYEGLAQAREAYEVV